MTHTITSLQHPLIKRLVRLRNNRKSRHQEQSVVIEGKKMVCELAQTHTPNALFATDPTLFPRNLACSCYLITKDILKKVTGAQTPEGILAEFPLPTFSSLAGCTHILALDQIKEPGNLGTLIRTALALGWDGVFLLDGCCDPFNDKALRSAKGATFHLPLAKGSWEKLSSLIQQENWTPLAADLGGVPLPKVNTPQKCLLVLGNESLGLSEEAKQHCQRITIPLSEKAESLNVSAAGAILMNHLISKEA